MFLDSRREDKRFWTEWLASITQIQSPLNFLLNPEHCHIKKKIILEVGHTA
jgi:hypothetical protein